MKDDELKKLTLSKEEIDSLKKDIEESERTVKMLHIKIQKLQSEVQGLKNDELSIKSEIVRATRQKENQKKFIEKEKMIKESYQAIQFYK